MMCDLTVLVIPRRIRRSEVDTTVGVLENFGARPAWTILVTPRTMSAAPAGRADDVPAPPTAANGHAKPTSLLPPGGTEGRLKAGAPPQR